MPGSSIRTNRESKNYTQEYVAKQMGISQNAYSKIENGYTQLTVSHLKEISRVLEVSLMDLLKDDFEIHKPNHSKIEEEYLITRTHSDGFSTEFISTKNLCAGRYEFWWVIRSRNGSTL